MKLKVLFLQNCESSKYIAKLFALSIYSVDQGLTILKSNVYSNTPLYINRQGHRWALVLLNSLLHWLFLNHDIIFLFLDHIEKKIKFWILLKTSWKMEHLLQKSKCSNFHNIFIHYISKGSKDFLWSKWLTPCTLDNFSWFFLSADFFKSTFSKKRIIGIPSECQTDWIQIRPDILLGIILVQSVRKVY